MIRAMTASVAPSDERAGVAHEDLGRVDVEPEEAEQRPDDAARTGPRGSAGPGTLRRAMIRKRDEGEDERPAGQPVEAVGEVDAVAHAPRSRTPRRRCRATGRSPTAPTNGTRDRGDVVGVLDLPGREDAPPTICQRSFWRARIPSPVRALSQSSASAEGADEGERRERGERRRVDAGRSRSASATTTTRSRAPPAVGVPCLGLVALRALHRGSAWRSRPSAAGG